MHHCAWGRAATAYFLFRLFESSVPMPVRRGLVPPAIVTSSIVLVLCCLGWGALAVVAIAPNLTLDPELFRYLNTILATATICAVLVHLFARLVRAIRLADDGYATGYAEGYTGALGAAPEAVPSSVTRLVPTRR